MTELHLRRCGGDRVAYTDKTLTCVECKTEFVFTARDQEFHASKGFTNEPKRCANCRQARRVARGETTGAPFSASAPAASGPRSQVYSGPRARGGSVRPQGPMNRNGGRPRRRDDGDRGEGAAVGARSFGDGGELTGGYTGACAACGNETAIPANGEARLILCEACQTKMSALTRS
jgi:hypothetical protein